MKNFLWHLAAVIALSITATGVQARNNPALYNAMEQQKESMMARANVVAETFGGRIVNVEAGLNFKKQLEYEFKLARYTDDKKQVKKITIIAGTGEVIKLSIERERNLPSEMELAQLVAIEDIVTKAEAAFGKYVVETSLENRYGKTYIYEVKFQHQNYTQKMIYDARTGEPLSSAMPDDNGPIENILCQMGQGIWVYSEPNWQGDYAFISNDTPDLGVMNKRMQSYRLPCSSEWQVRFYTGKDYTGEYYTRRGNGHGGDERFTRGWTDVIQSVQILNRKN